MPITKTCNGSVALQIVLLTFGWRQGCCATTKSLPLPSSSCHDGDRATFVFVCQSQRSAIPAAGQYQRKLLCSWKCRRPYWLCDASVRRCGEITAARGPCGIARPRRSHSHAAGGRGSCCV